MFLYIWLGIYLIKNVMIHWSENLEFSLKICIKQGLIFTMKLRQIFRYIFFNEKVWILLNIALIFFLMPPMNNKPNQQQAIVWTNNGIVHWHKKMSHSVNMSSCSLKFQLNYLLEYGPINPPRTIV